MKWMLIVLNVVVGLLLVGCVVWSVWFNDLGSADFVSDDCIGIIGGSDGPTAVWISSPHPVGIVFGIVCIILPFLPFANAVMLYKLGKHPSIN